MKPSISEHFQISAYESYGIERRRDEEGKIPKKLLKSQ